MYAIRVYETTFDPEQIYDGDYGPDAETVETVHTYDPTWDEEGPLLWAVKTLQEVDCTEGSSSPPFHQGDWFTHIDGSYETNAYTGERCDPSAHPEGFGDAQLRIIARKVKWNMHR